MAVSDGDIDAAGRLQSSSTPLLGLDVRTVVTPPQELVSETQPPQTGTTLPFIWPPPHHLQNPPPFEEPVLPFPPAESLLSREIKLDTLRCEEPSKHQGKQVYDSLNRPPHDDYTNARGATSAEDMPRWYVPQGAEDETLLFESRFESGNLRSAEKIGASEYNLQLAFDINTDRHTQWFYFRLSNLRKDRPYKLNMQNLMKTEAVYNLGMQPLAYSEVRAKKEGVGWYRTGSDACYFKNQMTRAGAKPFWTLTFTIETAHDEDMLYLAHCFPYRYTDLQRYLSEKEASPLGRSFAMRRRTLCETLAGNDCDMLTITSPGAGDAEKKGIVISARVHPGESNASWMMKGVLDFLTSDNLQAAALRNKFIFKIVPMLNPDGVIVGNYRCSLAGGDLNRQYEDPKRELFPEVLNLKQMIANFGMGKEVLLYVDLHGHSKKSNIFMYGVQNPTDEALYMRERVIPTLLHRASPLFNLEDCTFDVGKGKDGCGRVVVRKQLGVVNAYTMEASFMGADQGEFQGIHFNQGHFESMGHSLCEMLLELVDPDQSNVESIVRQLVQKYPIDQSLVVLPKRDDGAVSSSDDSDGSDAPKRPPAKLPSKPPNRDSVRSRRGCRSAGPGKKGSPRERDEGRRTGGGSGSESDSSDEASGKQGTRGELKGIACGGAEKCKPVIKVPPGRVTARITVSTTPPLPQKPTPVQVPTPKAAKSGVVSKSSTASKAGTSKSSPRISGTPKNAATPGKNSSAKDKCPSLKGAAAAAAVVTDKAGSTSKATSSSAAGASATVAPKIVHKGGTTVRRNSAKAGAASGKSAGVGAGVSAGLSKQSKDTTPASVSGIARAGASVSKSKADKKRSCTTSGGKVPPRDSTACGPARRPASSPASRSISSPRRHAAAAASQRSPSAPQNRLPVATGSRRVAATGSTTRGGKVKGGVVSADGGGGKPSPDQAKRKKGGKKEELPLPPRRNKSAAATKSSK